MSPAHCICALCKLQEYILGMLSELYALSTYTSNTLGIRTFVFLYCTFDLILTIMKQRLVEIGVNGLSSEKREDILDVHLSRKMSICMLQVQLCISFLLFCTLIQPSSSGAESFSSECQHSWRMTYF